MGIRLFGANHKVRPYVDACRCAPTWILGEHKVRPYVGE